MPIKPENRQYYSTAAGWPAIRERILARSGGQCEFCGVANGAPRGQYRVVLTIAHLDQNPGNNHEQNLRALCQRCHLNYDRPFHWAKRHQRRIQEKDQRRPLLGGLL